MEIRKNSRQMPKDKAIVSAKNYSDILYGHLQVISLRDEESGLRYVPKKDVKFTKLAEEIGYTRQTISTRFKKLEELGLIKKSEDGRIFLPIIDKTKAFLIPKPTLQRMVAAFSENAINVYVYLINRFFANNEQPFEFTLMGMKDYLGLGTKSTSNNYMVTEILEFLQNNMGLITYHMSTRREGNETKTYYHLDCAYLDIKA